MGTVEIERSRRKKTSLARKFQTLVPKLSRCLARRMWDRRVFLVLEIRLCPNLLLSGIRAIFGSKQDELSGVLIGQKKSLKIDCFRIDIC